jgi:hypothetical protein
MRLSQQNEWIAIGALIAYISLVPCPYAMKEFFSSAIGKIVALSTVVFVWKYVSELLAVLVLVAFLRSGAVREYLDASTPTMPSCPPGQMMDTSTNKCKDVPTTSQMSSSQVVLTAPPTAPGPPGGSTPGGAAAAISALNQGGVPSIESFSPKEDNRMAGSPFSTY